ncbi:MAG: xanthine dehydrogenase family protein subunit M [Acidobacteria bacterium]|nr:MAG: xanthine dehydrogenase family protein subunit M [Acidobacteriota bacterium]
MTPLSDTRAGDVATAVREVAADGAAQCIASGTNLIDLMQAHVERPSRLIDLTRLPLADIRPSADGGRRLGALVTNTDVAYDAPVERRYPLVSKAILAGASPPLRTMATGGGTLLQRTRGDDVDDTATPCHIRQPGTGCAAIDGCNRLHAILGPSAQASAVHPSDRCVALAALEAVIRLTGPGGERALPFAAFHRPPGDTPPLATNLAADAIITAVDLPPKGFAAHHAYLQIRDRTSDAFALVSVAAALAMDGDTITAARLALGGVAHQPWRDRDAEARLKGQSATRDHVQRAADALLRDARGFGHHPVTIELAQRAMGRALRRAAAGEAHR